jgi:hypothetical protein
VSLAQFTTEQKHGVLQAVVSSVAYPHVAAAT